MYLLPIFVSVVASLPDYRLLLIAANNVHHSTIERARTPKEVKRFRVLDAETGAPVKGAHVVAVHRFDWLDDWVIDGTTDDDGVVKIELAKQYLHALYAWVEAQGYLTRDRLYFDDATRTPGTGRLADDPIDVRIYKGPAAVSGLRVPVGFRGVLVYGMGEPQYDFQYPPNFPAGQRVWWTDAKPGR
jgi:hypothetical protein